MQTFDLFLFPQKKNDKRYIDKYVLSKLGLNYAKTTPVELSSLISKNELNIPFKNYELTMT